MRKNTRDRILGAGLKLFSSKGYLGATTKEIARAAGVAELTLFRHFASKERLFEEVLKENSFLTVLKELIPGISEMPYEKAMIEIAGKMLEALAERKGMIMIMHAEISRYPDQIHEIYHSFIDEMVGTLSSYFDSLVNKGLLRQFDTAYGARAFFGMFYSYFNSQEFMLRKKYREADPDRAVSEFVGIFVNGTLRKGALEMEAK